MRDCTAPPAGTPGQRSRHAGTVVPQPASAIRTMIAAHAVCALRSTLHVERHVVNVIPGLRRQ